MEPIMNVRLKQKGAPIPDTIQPIFMPLSLQKVKHYDNKKNEEMSEAERNKVTRITYSVYANAINGYALPLLSDATYEEAAELYNRLAENIDYTDIERNPIPENIEDMEEGPEPVLLEIKETEKKNDNNRAEPQGQLLSDGQKDTP